MSGGKSQMKVSKGKARLGTNDAVRPLANDILSIRIFLKGPMAVGKSG